jgi:D-inositol-3-phosphate glycosyltransferase
MRHPLRVALVSEHASPLAVLGGVDAGGQNVHVASLAVELAAQGTQVQIFTRRDSVALPEVVAMGPGVTVVHLDAGPPTEVPKDEMVPFLPALASGLERWWRTEPPDVVHAHFWMSGVVALAASRRLSAPPPVVQTFHALGVVKRRHQGERDTSPPERLAAERTIVQRADHIIATCSDEVFELLRLGAGGNEVSVVPCGVDPERFSPDGPSWPRHGHRRRILSVGRLVERKGIGNVITALAGVPDAELLVAGGPPADGLANDPEVQRLVSLASDEGVEDRVRFLGRVDRDSLPGLMRSADAIVCVPWYEPFGIVPLEAMACGRPVVAAAVGGLVDTVVDGVTGVHVPPRRPDELATVLRSLLDDPRGRANLGTAGVDRVRCHYSWQRVGTETLNIYRQLLADVRSRRSGEDGRRTSDHMVRGGAESLARVVGS